MEPIDTYREKGFYGVRLIELFDDRIVVKGSRLFAGDFNVPVPLASLEPTVALYGHREKIWLITLVALAGGIYNVCAWSAHPPVYSNPGYWFGWFFTGLGIFLLFRAVKRIETVAFYTSAGVLRFTLSKMGPDVGRFQDFVERVKSQIGICRTAQTGTP
jgi:hypothetical protein